MSLNAPNEEIRDYVMPINKKYPLSELLAACKEHASQTGDKVTFEYVLLKGVTDSLEDAKALHKLTRGIPCKINIIPFNDIRVRIFKDQSAKVFCVFRPSSFV